MKKKELEKLLGFLDQDDQSIPDFAVFRDPDNARKRFKELQFFREMNSDNEKDFSPYFTGKVMQRITQLTNKHGIEEYLSLQFSRVMTFGLSSVILVFLILYFIQRQDGLGSIIGTDHSNDINFISYLFYEF